MWHSIRCQKALGRRNKIGPRERLGLGGSEEAPRKGWRAEPEQRGECQAKEQGQGGPGGVAAPGEGPARGLQRGREGREDLVALFVLEAFGRALGTVSL